MFKIIFSRVSRDSFDRATSLPQAWVKLQIAKFYQQRINYTLALQTISLIVDHFGTQLSDAGREWKIGGERGRSRSVA